MIRETAMADNCRLAIICVHRRVDGLDDKDGDEGEPVRTAVERR
jgi:hypothetical protein